MDDLTALERAQLTAFAAHLGIEPAHLLLYVARAVVKYSRTHGELTFPLNLGLPSSSCILCPHAKEPSSPLPPENIQRGPWA